MLRNAISHHANPVAPTSTTSVAELNSSLVVNTSGVSSPLLEFAPRTTGSAQLVSALSSVEKRKRKPASRDLEPQGGFPDVHDSFDQLRPAGSGPVAPSRNPAPNADLETYQSMQAKAGRDPAAHIRMALWCEQHGLNAEKLKHLSLAVLKDPQNTLARGLMGLLPNGGRWETPEAVSARLRADELLTARLAEYNRRRDELQAFENSTMPVGTTVQNRWATHHPGAEVAAAHAKLGVWCEQNGLKPEATAHFTQAVELDPYRDSAWKHLGYVKHNGRWMNREQIAAEEKEAIEQTRANRLWEPRLKRWKTWLKDEKLRDQATTEMKSVTDPHAVPAVVRIFAQGNERDQVAAVHLLGQIDFPSSTHALLRLAVLSASDAVRSTTTEALLRREPRDFAGWLIDYIRTPWQYHVQPVGGPGSPGALQIVAPRSRCSGPTTLLRRSPSATSSMVTSGTT